MISLKQQQILRIIWKKGSKASIKDFVPSLFKYHSSFYRSFKGLEPYVRKQKDKNGKNIFILNLDGYFLANLLER